MDYFVQNVLLPSINRTKFGHLNDKNLFDIPIELDLDIDIQALIDAEIKKHEETQNVQIDKGFDVNMSGYDYEYFCTELLQKNGWKCRTTPASGDQGADIIADMKGHTIVVQCKKSLSTSIGNKAVQEVYSAKNYYEADTAVVVTNSSYSRSARILANKLGVILLHHEELPTLAKKLGCC